MYVLTSNPMDNRVLNRKCFNTSIGNKSYLCILGAFPGNKLDLFSIAPATQIPPHSKCDHWFVVSKCLLLCSKPTVFNGQIDKPGMNPLMYKNQTHKKVTRTVFCRCLIKYEASTDQRSSFKWFDSSIKLGSTNLKRHYFFLFR